jgi:hypothetical protein
MLRGEYFQDAPPIHPISLTNFGNRLRPTAGEAMLRRILGVEIALSLGQERELIEFLVDITAMEKAGTYPRNSKLVLKRLLRLSRGVGRCCFGVAEGLSRVRPSSRAERLLRRTMANSCAHRSAGLAGMVRVVPVLPV